MCCIPKVLPWASSLQWQLTGTKIQNNIPASSVAVRTNYPRLATLRMLEFCGNWSHALSFLCAVRCPLNLTESIRKNAPGMEKGWGKRASGRTKIGRVRYKSEENHKNIWGWRLSKTILATRFLLQDKTIFTSRPSKWASTRHLTSLKPPFLSFYCYPSFSCRLPSRHYLYLNFLVIHFESATTISISYHVQS